MHLLHYITPTALRLVAPSGPVLQLPHGNEYLFLLDRPMIDEADARLWRWYTIRDVLQGELCEHRAARILHETLPDWDEGVWLPVRTPGTWTIYGGQNLTYRGAAVAKVGRLELHPALGGCVARAVFLAPPPPPRMQADVIDWED